MIEFIAAQIEKAISENLAHEKEIGMSLGYAAGFHAAFEEIMVDFNDETLKRSDIHRKLAERIHQLGEEK